MEDLLAQLNEFPNRQLAEAIKREFAKSNEQLQAETERHKTTQEKWEAALSLLFTILRALITSIILMIFVVIDLNILLAIKDFDIKTIFEFSPEQLSIIKYGIGFLMLQVLVFSQKFGFSNIINTINMLRGKNIQPEPKENEK